jgi:hypothetical protein
MGRMDQETTTAPVISFRATRELREAIARQALAAGMSPGAIVRRLAEAAWAAQPDANRSAP